MSDRTECKLVNAEFSPLNIPKASFGFHRICLLSDTTSALTRLTIFKSEW
jgi:hypothetical protein